MNFKYSTLGFDKIYVINLKRRKDRKDKLIKDYPELNFTFIEAIDGKEVTLENLNLEEMEELFEFDKNVMRQHRLELGKKYVENKFPENKARAITATSRE